MEERKAMVHVTIISFILCARKRAAKKKNTTHNIIYLFRCQSGISEEGEICLRNKMDG